MNIIVGEELIVIFERMQPRVPANGLIAVADDLPQMARLLWGQRQQEPSRVAMFLSSKVCPLPQGATECVLAKRCGGDDSEVARDNRLLRQLPCRGLRICKSPTIQWECRVQMFYRTARGPILEKTESI